MERLLERLTIARRALANDRNLTTHTYNEALAEHIGNHLADHAQLIGTWLTAMETRAANLSVDPEDPAR